MSAAGSENVPPATKSNVVTVETIRARLNQTQERKCLGAIQNPSRLSTTAAGSRTRLSAKSKSATPSAGSSGANDDTDGVPTDEYRSGRNTLDGRLREDSTFARSVSPREDIHKAKDIHEIKDKFDELSAVAEEILTYCHLLESSRTRVRDSTSSMREAIRELEKLHEAARNRETSQLSYAETQREAMSAFEKRYYSLKSRARLHIKEIQEERDRLLQEVTSLQTRLKNTESQLASAHSALSSQTAQLDRIREQTKSMPTEKEITQMRLQLRRLEDENGRLATERAQLMIQIDELGAKRDVQSGRPRAARNKLEDALAQCQQERDQLAKELTESRQQAEEWRQYCAGLLEKVPSDTQLTLKR